MDLKVREHDAKWLSTRTLTRDIDGQVFYDAAHGYSKGILARVK